MAEAHLDDELPQLAPRLLDVHARLDRAREHVEEFKRFSTAYIQANQASSLIEIKGHTFNPILPPEPPPLLGICVGEVIYNLRSALDYLVYRLAELNVGKPVKGTKFPIEDARKSFLGRRTTFLNGVNKAHMAAIESLQPYNGVRWTKALRDLSNAEQHRAIHLLGYAASSKVSVGLSEDEAKAIGGFRRAGDDVSMYFPAPIVVTFEDRTPVEVAIKYLLTETCKVVETFEPEFEGKPLSGEIIVNLDIERIDAP